MTDLKTMYFHHDVLSMYHIDKNQKVAAEAEGQGLYLARDKIWMKMRRAIHRWLRIEVNL
jgi:hypothetical protein